MIIIIGLAVITLIGLILLATDVSEELGFATMLSGALVLILVLVLIPVNRIDAKAQIAEFNSFKATIAEARQNGIDDIERAALVNKIAGWNEWEASAKFWKGSYLAIFWPDEVMTLEPIK